MDVMTKCRLGVLWIATVAAGTCALPGCKSAKAPPSPVRATQPTANDAARAELLAQYDLTGHITLIQFGTVGCELSDKGLGEMALLCRLKAIDDLSFLRVEGSKDDAAVEAYYRERPPGFAVHRDRQGRLAKTFDATATPTFILVGRFGRIRYRGSQANGRLGRWVKTLHREQADPGPDVALLGQVKLHGPKLLANTTLEDLTGRRRRLADLAGPGGLLVVFVDTDCPFAQRAMGELPTVARTIAPRGIPTVVINLDESAKVVREHYAGRNLPGPLLYDATPATKNNWNIQSVPTVVYVAADKTLAYNGKAVWAELAVAVEQALELEPGSVRFTAKGTRYG